MNKGAWNMPMVWSALSTKIPWWLTLTHPDYAKQLKADLKRSIPNVKIREIIPPYDGSEIYDEKFGSACGLYTNMLVTPERIYFPQFGIKEDAVVLQQIRSHNQTYCCSSTVC